jgi:hypothetical protein
MTSRREFLIRATAAGVERSFVSLFEQALRAVLAQAQMSVG